MAKRKRPLKGSSSDNGAGPVGPIVRQRSRPPKPSDSGMPVAPDKPSPALDGGAGQAPAGDNGPAYKVGNKCPPLHTRWKPGQSGNPKGREKDSKNVGTIYRVERDRKVEVTENGKRKKLTKAEIAIKALLNKAAKGDPKALDQVLKLEERYGGSGASGGSGGAGGGALEAGTTFDERAQRRLNSYRWRAFEEGRQASQDAAPASNGAIDDFEEEGARP